TVIATDGPAGVRNLTIGVRRHGDDVWHELAPTSVDGSTYTAHLDDEHLPDGVYEVRAHAVDAAGNERTTNLDAAGRPVELTLPLRVATTLKMARLVESGRRGHRVM